MMDAARILAAIDAERFADVLAFWGKGSGPADERREKYLDLATWIEMNLRRVKAARLDSSPPRRVLDIGTGCGYFPFVCRLFGHDAMGIDRPEDRSLFTDVRALLEVSCMPHVVRSFESLPDLGRFDAITAYMVTFNGHRTSALWGVAEWRFFLDDIEPRLAPGGVIALELNREPNGRCYTAELRQFFADRGAQIDRHRVMFRR